MVKVVAFVPVRGGSQSIPLKNIKPFCGKPLVYWNISALEAVAEVDEIVIATDSEAIINEVLRFGFKKVVIYRRLPENATNTASTESVMLEYIERTQADPANIFMLVQATSPLTQAQHFSEALKLYGEGQFDSLLTCVRNKRFFWNEDGSPRNYDHSKRPRRQDFEGALMENGAFYISTVDRILTMKNRLSGKIGIYEMPEYSAIEIDEEDDWALAEKLMYKYYPFFAKGKRMSEVKLFLTDVDGVLTDAGMYYSEKGDELKKFNTHDGMAFSLLRQAGIKTGIITSENTELVARRAHKLKADYLYQGHQNGGKLACALEICKLENLTLDEVAYIGDDVNCWELLSQVGIAACPSNAVEKIKNIPGIIPLAKEGGQGAVREFAEIILEKKNNIAL
jgi:N-acylneuraminate cytidylyltransferase